MVCLTLTPVITSLTRDFRPHVGMVLEASWEWGATFSGMVGGSSTPRGCPGTTALPKLTSLATWTSRQGRISSGGGLCRHLCSLPAGATTFHPVSWGGSHALHQHTYEDTDFLLQLPVAACAAIFLPNGVSVIFVYHTHIMGLKPLIMVKHFEIELCVYMYFP